MYVERDYCACARLARTADICGLDEDAGWQVEVRSAAQVEASLDELIMMERYVECEEQANELIPG